MDEPYYIILNETNRLYRMLVLPIVILAGICGQLISIKIFLGQKQWHSTCKAYYLTMAAADLVYLLVLGIPSLTSFSVGTLGLWTKDTKYTFEPTNYSHMTCKVFAYFTHGSSFISYWSLIAYAIERLIAIWKPFFRVQYITLKNATRICIAILIFTAITFSPILFANPYKLLYEDQIIYYRYCGLNVQNESIFVQVWYLVTVAILSVFAGSAGLLIVNALLLLKLRSCCTRKRSLLALNRMRQTPEMKSAKDILILSIITFAFAAPLLVWAGYAAASSMLVFLIRSAFNLTDKIIT